MEPHREAEVTQCHVVIVGAERGFKILMLFSGGCRLQTLHHSSLFRLIESKVLDLAQVFKGGGGGGGGGGGVIHC